MRIAVDAMGGDHAPRRPVDGALAAARHLGIGIDLVGRADLIRDELVRHPDAAGLDVSIVDAPDLVTMEESAALALRRKPRSSVMVAAGRVRDGHAGALVTAGHTGAAVVAGTGVYGYDELDRLVSATYPGGGSATYAYDPNGNRTAVVSGGQTTAYSYDDADQLIALLRFIAPITGGKAHAR